MCVIDILYNTYNVILISEFTGNRNDALGKSFILKNYKSIFIIFRHQEVDFFCWNEMPRYSR